MNDPVIAYFAGVFTTFILIALYLVPAIIAYKRRLEGRNAIFWLNILLGWTIIGWFGLIYLTAKLTDISHDNHQIHF